MQLGNSRRTLSDRMAIAGEFLETNRCCLPAGIAQDLRMRPCLTVATMTCTTWQHFWHALGWEIKTSIAQIERDHAEHKIGTHNTTRWSTSCSKHLCRQGKREFSLGDVQKHHAPDVPMESVAAISDDSVPLPLPSSAAATRHVGVPFARRHSSWDIFRRTRSRATGEGWGWVG